MTSKFFYILFLLAIFNILLFIFRQNNNSYLKPIIEKNTHKKEDCINYRRKCNQLFTKLRYPNQSLIIRPPLKMPPKDLINRFTQNGDMPITKSYYFDEVYSDSNSNNKNIQENVTAFEFEELLKKLGNNEPVGWYGESSLSLEAIMNKYLNKIKNKSLVVIGTQMPWVEAIGYRLLVSHITTLDYTRKHYETERLEWLHVNDYLEDLISNTRKIETFDASASFSSIEHSGLGRYGDPLSPEGDINAVQQVHCLLKPGGFFFLGLPTSSDDSSYIEFNAHRVYGSKRLKLLFDGWTKVDQVESRDGVHSIFVLEKIGIC